MLANGEEMPGWRSGLRYLIQEVAMYRSDLPTYIKSDMLALSVCLTAILFKLIDITWGAIF